MKRIGVVSLGCAKNLVDTERMLGLLKQAGFQFVARPEDADILIVNTCGFIEPAKQESINTILEMAQYKVTGSCTTLVVTGCLSQRYRAELSEAIPEIDILIGVHEYQKLPGLLRENPPIQDASARVLTTPPYRAFLRIADGCDNRCTYCAIPLIRGPLVSEPMERLLDEAAALAEDGVTELTVIAQDTSGYGRDLYHKSCLPELLTKLSDIPALHWIRVLYTYPDTVNPELIRAIQGNPKLVNYLDMPIQHVSDPILARMHRRGAKAHIRSILEYVETHAPDFILRTTAMVGFPGETELQFQELLDFLRQHPFDRVGAFAFSPEEGTAAASMDGQVPEAVKSQRLDTLMLQQKAVAREKSARRVGAITEVLIEGSLGRGYYGRSYAEAPDVDGKVILPNARNLHPGEYRMTRLLKPQDYDMIGEIL